MSRKRLSALDILPMSDDFNRLTSSIPVSWSLLSSLRELRLNDSPGLTGTLSFESDVSIFCQGTNITGGCQGWC
jgi:hypothetical protein